MISYSFEEGDEIYAPVRQIGDAAVNFVSRMLIDPKDGVGFSARLVAVYNDSIKNMPEWAADKFRSSIIEMNSVVESPIELVALARMLSRKVCWHPSERYPVAIMERGSGEFVSITPQVKIGRFRADFVVDTPHGPSFLVECDGAEFHDAARDAKRDAEVFEKHGMLTLRATGKEIWGSSDWVDDFVRMTQGERPPFERSLF